MMDIYDRLYGQLEELIPGLTELEPGDYRKSEAGGFMDLHLDVLGRTDTELRIALAHNYTQNGDTIPDPDMEIRVYLIPDWKKAEALTYQDQYRYDQVYPEPNLVIPRLKKSLNSFLAQWLKNIKAQGHKLEAEDMDKSGNVIYPLCLKACPMGYTEAQIREGLCTEICESVQEEDEDE